jgi:hypothetical protein
MIFRRVRSIEWQTMDRSYKVNIPRNCWEQKWGIKGYFTIPDAYVREQDWFIYFPQSVMATAIDRTTS